MCCDGSAEGAADPATVVGTAKMRLAMKDVLDRLQDEQLCYEDFQGVLRDVAGGQVYDTMTKGIRTFTLDQLTLHLMPAHSFSEDGLEHYFREHYLEFAKTRLVPYLARFHATTIIK